MSRTILDAPLDMGITILFLSLSNLCEYNKDALKAKTAHWLSCDKLHMLAPLMLALRHSAKVYLLMEATLLSAARRARCKTCYMAIYPAMA